MKKLVALILAVMMIVAATAALAEQKVPKIAYVPRVEGQAWWENVHKYVDMWAEEHGIEVIYKGPAEVTAEAQIPILQDMINQDVDILCTCLNDTASGEEILKAAREKGIIVIATENEDLVNCDFDVEPHLAAEQGAFLMDLLAKQMGEEGQYITMVGSLTFESQNAWADGAVARQKEAYPNMELVPDARVEDNSDAQQAYELTIQLKEKYPDLKGILGTGSFDAPGAARAIEEMGLTGKMFATSVAIPSEVSDFMKSGALQGVSVWNAGISAQAQLNAGLKLFNGETIETGTDLGVEGYESVVVEGNHIFGKGDVAVTPENVDDFGF